MLCCMTLCQQCSVASSHARTGCRDPSRRSNRGAVNIEQPPTALHTPVQRACSAPLPCPLPCVKTSPAPPLNTAGSLSKRQGVAGLSLPLLTEPDVRLSIHPTLRLNADERHSRFSETRGPCVPGFRPQVGITFGQAPPEQLLDLPN